MTVSVVIPCFNSENSIEETIRSVFNQTLLPNEVICIDDGSTDTTLNILNELKNVSPPGLFLKIIQQENSGPSSARNNGVLAAKCEYIAFLDSDDVWHPQKLEIIFQLILKHNLDFIYHLYSPFPYSDLEEIGFGQLQLKKKTRFAFAFKNFIATPTVLVKKSKFVKFPEGLSYCEDYCCWLMTNESDFFFIDQNLANGFKKPLGESGLSSNIYQMHLGFLAALKYLRKHKKISIYFYLIATFFEYVKFPLRYFR